MKSVRSAGLIVHALNFHSRASKSTTSISSRLAMGLQGELHLTQCLTKECVQLTGSRGCAYALPGSRLQQRDERLPVDQLVAGPPVCVCVCEVSGWSCITSLHGSVCVHTSKVLLAWSAVMQWWRTSMIPTTSSWREYRTDAFLHEVTTVHESSRCC